MIIDFQVTARCNLNCKYCFDILKGEKDVDTNMILRSLEMLSRSGVTGIVITGGEPLMRDDIGEIVKKSTELGMSVYLSTNGKYLLEKGRNFLKDLYCIGMPLDTQSSEIHELCGRPSNQANITLECVDYIKNNFPNIRLKVGTVFTKYNEDTLSNVETILNDKLSALDTWRIYEFNPIGNGLINKKVLKVEHEKFIKETNKIMSHEHKYVISPMSIKDSENAYIFIGPDMHLLVYAIDDFIDYGNIIELGSTRVRELLTNDFANVVDKSNINRKWVVRNA